MAKQKTVSDAAFIELRAIQNIIGMARFAAEARRVLDEMHVMAGCSPQFSSELRKHVDAPFDWIDYPDCAAAVLNDVYYRLDVLLEED